MLINTQALRNKILTLAVQGKLVPQDQADGTAEELFIQIQQEKQTLSGSLKKDTVIASEQSERGNLLTMENAPNLHSKTKKQKPLPPITADEIPFDIPETWKWVRWGNLSYSIQYGYNAPAKSSGCIKMVRITDIQDGKILWDTVPFCSDISENEIENYLLRKNDILFARTGGTVGKSYLVKEVSEKAIYAGYLIRTQYNSDYISPEYLKFFMESELYWQQLRSGTIATAQPNCNGQTLAKMIIPLPPLAEQQRIVEKVEQAFIQLDEIDALQAQYQDNLTAFQTKLLKLAIHGELSAQYRRKNQAAVASNTISGSLNDENHHPNCHCETCQKASRGNLLATENQANNYNDKEIATTATQSRNDGVLTAFDEIAAYNAKITQMKGQRETLLLQIEKQHKSEKNAHRKARLKTLSGSLKNKIKTYRTITPLNQNPDFTPPFAIPKEWAWVKLGEICEITSGGTPSKNIEKFWQNGTIKWASVRDMKCDFIENTEFKITKEALENSNSNIVRKNSLIIATRVGLGKVCIAKDDIAINQDLKGLTCKFILLNYLFLFFKKSAEFILESGTGTTVKGVKLDFIENLPIPLPPLAEQQFIAGQLEKLLDLCKKLKTKP